MLKITPPVGNPITTKIIPGAERIISEAFKTDSLYFYGSGTMALAAAILAVKSARQASSPEVLLPAYACPDLVSAALYAGVKPVLVDLEKGRPWMDLASLRNAISPNTIAVIAAHFLGVQERLSDIRQCISGSDIALIEDSAQLFTGRDPSAAWQGDLVVLSFGRGKPVSLLGGGLVISRQEKYENFLTNHASARFSARLPLLSRSRFDPRILAYNLLLNPVGYGILKRLPFLQIGATVFKPLQDIQIMPGEKLAILAANIVAYRARSMTAAGQIHKILEGLNLKGLVDLPGITDHPAGIPLLRYPVLLSDKYQRDEAMQEFHRAGIGVTSMYQRILPEIPGLENVLTVEGDFQNGNDFAGRLLTLPCHSGMNSDRLAEIERVLQRL